MPGLRRTEVASLAGMSVEYYSRLERGNLAGVSEEVLEALSRALELDEAEASAHLYDLARAAASSPDPHGGEPSPNPFVRACRRPSMPSLRHPP